MNKTILGLNINHTVIQTMSQSEIKINTSDKKVTLDASVKRCKTIPTQDKVHMKTHIIFSITPASQLLNIKTMKRKTLFFHLSTHKVEVHRRCVVSRMFGRCEVASDSQDVAALLDTRSRMFFQTNMIGQTKINLIK